MIEAPAALTSFGARTGEVHDDIEVVDHQVEHDIHIRAPDRERRGPFRGHIPRRFEQGLDRGDSGIEPFDMSDLKDQPLSGPPGRSVHRPAPGSR